jgi:hypothetical protein
MPKQRKPVQNITTETQNGRSTDHNSIRFNNCKQKSVYRRKYTSLNALI